MGSNTPKIIFTGLCIFIACIGLCPFNTVKADLFDKADMRDTVTFRMLRDSFISQQELKKPALVKLKGTVSCVESHYNKLRKKYTTNSWKFAFLEVTTKSGKYTTKTDMLGRFTLLLPTGCKDTIVVKKQAMSESYFFYSGNSLPINIANKDTTIEMQLTHSYYWLHYCPRF
jgi:hypothetical protein